MTNPTTSPVENHSIDDGTKPHQSGVPSGNSVPGSVGMARPEADSNLGDFSRQANEAQPTLVAEFLDFLVNNKAWWLTPIILVLLLVGILIAIGSSAAAPFIYTLF